MIQTSEGRILTINGMVIERRANTLLFTFRGTVGPNFSISDGLSACFAFGSLINQKVIVNWGDGVIETLQFAQQGNPNFPTFAIGWTNTDLSNYNVSASALKPRHNYIDGNSGARVVSFMFEDITKLFSFITHSALYEGAFPTDILRASNLTTLNLQSPAGLISLPNLTDNKKLLNLAMTNLKSTKYPKIPDSFFECTKLKTLHLTNSFDLSDNIGSNFFKLNQLKDLEVLDIENCNVSSLDENFGELTKLLDLRMRGSAFLQFPAQLYNLQKLNYLYFSTAGSNIPLFSFDNFNDLRTVIIAGDYDLTDLPTKWKKAYMLSSLGGNSFFVAQAKFNQFIDVFYELCTVNGYILPNVAPAPYPNRFRNIAWGVANRIFTGAKVAPAGYVQGVSNGTPINQGQKVYVLQNQYNHTITHA